MLIQTLRAASLPHSKISFDAVNTLAFVLLIDKLPCWIVPEPVLCKRPQYYMMDFWCAEMIQYAGSRFTKLDFSLQPKYAFELRFQALLYYYYFSKYILGVLKGKKKEFPHSIFFLFWSTVSSFSHEKVKFQYFKNINTYTHVYKIPYTYIHIYFSI